MPLDFEAIGDDLSKLGAESKIVFPALGRIYAEYQKLEPTTRASLVADIHALAAQFGAMGTALAALEADDEVQKLGGAVQFARTLAQAASIGTRVAKDLQAVAGADYAVIKPDALLILNTLHKGTPT
jgi:hypothetical protein